MFSWTAGYVDNVANLKREFALVSGFGSETVFIRVQVDREREFLSTYTNSVGWKESRFLERSTVSRLYVRIFVSLKDNSLFGLAGEPIVLRKRVVPRDKRRVSIRTSSNSFDATLKIDIKLLRNQKQVSLETGQRWHV